MLEFTRSTLPSPQSYQDTEVLVIESDSTRTRLFSDGLAWRTMLSVDGTTDPRVTAAQMTSMQALVSGGGNASDRYARYADGVPTTAGNGSLWDMHGFTPAQRPKVVSGKLVLDSTLVGGAYAQQALTGEQITRLGAKFTFSSYSTSAGAVTLVSWAQSISNTSPAIPDSPCHLVLSPTQWIYGVWSNNVFTQIAAGTYATALTADGAAEYSAEVVVDRQQAKAYVTLPDGSVVTVSDSRIGTLSGVVACWEIYRQALTDTKAAFVETWGQSGKSDFIPMTKAIVKAISFPVVVQYAPASDVSIAIPTSEATVDATNLAATITLPIGCSALEVTLSGYLGAATQKQVLWAVRIGATTYATQTVCNQAIDGLVNYTARIANLVGGGTYTVLWRHFATTSGATLRLNSPNGYVATMKLTPCA